MQSHLKLENSSSYSCWILWIPLTSSLLKNSVIPTKKAGKSSATSAICWPFTTTNGLEALLKDLGDLDDLESNTPSPTQDVVL